jgi:hypothetical protein
MSTVELTIKGDIQKLRLKKDDVVIIKIKSANVSLQQSAEINKQAREIFPNNRIVVMPENLDISIAGG